MSVRAILEKLRAALVTAEIPYFVTGSLASSAHGVPRINGSFLAADLIDELSILVVPVADGESGTPSLFDADDTPPARRLKLLSIEQRKGDLVWLRYKVSHAR